MMQDLILYDSSYGHIETTCDATTIAGPDSSRQPGEHELAMARSQGVHVAAIAAKLAA
jgi:NAD(P)H dehydrogenase (quinone)